MVAGAFQDDEAGSNEGAAYVFEKVGGTWQQTAKVFQTGASHLGQDAAIDGDILVAGAPTSSLNQGRVVVFEYVGGTWAETATLERTDANVNGGADKLGDSVDINGDVVLAGSPSDAEVVFAGGSATLFHKSGDTWSLVEKLAPPTLTASEFFGHHVALVDGLALVGAYSRPATALTTATPSSARHRAGVHTCTTRRRLRPPRHRSTSRIGS